MKFKLTVYGKILLNFWNVLFLKDLLGNFTGLDKFIIFERKNEPNLVEYSIKVSRTNVLINLQVF